MAKSYYGLAFTFSLIYTEGHFHLSTCTLNTVLCSKNSTLYLSISRPPTINEHACHLPPQYSQPEPHTMTGTGILIGCKRSEYDSSNAFFYSQPDPQLKPGMWLHRFTSRGTKIIKRWGTTSKNLKRLTLCHRHYQQLLMILSYWIISTSIFVYCTKKYYWERTQLWLTLAAKISWS